MSQTSLRHRQSNLAILMGKRCSKRTHPLSRICLVLFVLFFIFFSKSHGQQGQLEKARSLVEEGIVLRESGQFILAEKKLLTASDIFLKAEAYEEYSSCLFSLEYVYSITTQYDKRRGVIDKVIEVSETYLSEDHRIHTYAIARKGRHFMDVGKLDSSAFYLKRSISLQNVSKNASLYVWDCINLGFCLLELGDFLEVDSILHHALDTCVFYVPSEYHLISSIHSSLGRLNIRRGDYEVAAQNLEQSLLWGERRPGKTQNDSLNLGMIYNEYAGLFRQLGDRGLAIQYQKKGVDYLRRVPHNVKANLAPILSNLGQEQFRLGQFDEGLRNCTEAKQLFGKPGNQRVASNFCINLSCIVSIMLKNNQPDLEMAEELILEGLDLASKWGLEKEILYTVMADIHSIKGNLEAEMRSLKLGISNSEEFSWDKFGMNASLNGVLAERFTQLGQFDSALVYFQKGINLISLDFDEDDYARNPLPEGDFIEFEIVSLLRKKAKCLRKKALSQSQDVSLLKLALKSSLLADQVHDKFRGINRQEVTKDFISREGWETSLETILCAWVLHETTEDLQYLIQAFKAGEKSKSLSLLESQQEARADGYGKIPASLLTLEEDLKQKITLYNGLILEEKSRGPEQNTLKISTWDGKLFDLNRSHEAWIERVKKEYPAYSDRKHVTQVNNFEQVGGSLVRDGEVLVEYFLSEEEVFTFSIDQNGLRTYRDSLPPNFDSLISQFTQSLSDYRFVHDSVSQSYTQYTNSAHELYQLLLEPVLNDLPPRTKLIVVPDGPLSQIPFEVLLTEQPQPGPPNYAALPYLLKEHTVRYAYSAALLLEAQNRPAYAAKGGCLALAPSYKGASAIPTRGNLAVLRDGEAPLEGAQLEVQALSELGMPGEFLMGAAATEETFKALAPSYNLLHLALHGQADPEEQLNSSIRFAETPGDTCQDDLLHAYEMYAVPLKADLVVLSACESGVGEYLEGEGVMSLARHFMAAGASSVVMTQWQVEDQASADLMRLFYQNLQDGMRSADALHQAKLSFLENADSRTAHPFYWAGYIANGASKRLPMPKGWAGFGLVMGSLAFGLSIFGVAQWRNRREA